MILSLCGKVKKSIHDKKGFIFSFFLGFVIRIIPEVLSYPYPIGFDTVRDVAITKNGTVLYRWAQVFSTWLLYAILIPLYNAIKVDPFLLMKFAAPILYGLNALGMYNFAGKVLRWNEKKAILAIFFFSFQLASLRLSWDLHRNMLGMALLLFVLPLLLETNDNKKFSVFILLSVLVVFAHELTSVVMFVITFGYIVSSLLKKEKVKALRSAIAISPALVIFLISVYFFMFSQSFPFFTNIIDSQPIQVTGISFFLTNYLEAKTWQVQFLMYLDLASNILFLFSVLYLLFLPLILIGFFRSRLLDYWTLFLLFGSLNSLITPSMALPLWYRWMFMLAYPFTFYIVNGFEKVWLSKNEGVRPRLRFLNWMKISRRTGLGILFLMVVLASLFMTMRYDSYEVPAPARSVYFPPFPPTMLQNTIPLQDVNNVVEAFEWLDGIMENKSGVIVHQVFIAWALLYLKSTRTIIRFATDFGKALDLSVQNERNPIYLIWWNENIGWFDLAIPKNFRHVFSSGRISIFRNR